MQAADGALSAHCFHDSCSGKGWQDFKEQIGKPDPEHYDLPLTARTDGDGAPASPPPSAPPDAAVWLVQDDQARDALLAIIPQECRAANAVATEAQLATLR